jgi:SAM-dependent methyltransferase
LLEFSISHRLPIATHGSIPYKITVVPQWEPDLPDAVVAALPHEIPLPENSMDLVVLHHTLDFASFPHQTLREVSRTLKSGGHLLILGFNPFSLWGLRRLLNRDHSAPWNGRFITSARIEDWLGLLDFRLDKTIYSFYRMPIQQWARSKNPGSLEKIGAGFQLPLGAYYSIFAQKQVGAGIAIKPQWKPSKSIGMPIASGLSKSTVLSATETLACDRKSLYSNTGSTNKQ